MPKSKKFEIGQKVQFITDSEKKGVVIGIYQDSNGFLYNVSSIDKEGRKAVSYCHDIEIEALA